MIYEVRTYTLRPGRGDENEKGTRIVSLPLPHSESR
jgi:hypothetical protein